jgi:hypothetical protein
MSFIWDLYLRQHLHACNNRIPRYWALELKREPVVAVARKLSILLHRLWVSGKTYEPLRNQRVLTAAA